MISDFGRVLSSVWDLFGLEFTLYGFTFSFKAVLLWSLVAGLVIWFVGRMFSD